MAQIFQFDQLRTCDLIVDAVYKGGNRGNAGDDPLDPLVGGGNQGGFRYAGSPNNRTLRLCVLYSELSDPDWPDELNFEAGTFIYFGDNKRPGHELHDTPRKGNLILRNVFESVHAKKRQAIPPFFIFTKGGRGRDVVFRGVAVPGAVGIPQTEDLVAIWKTKAGERFQNYRAVFTVLNIPSVSRNWIDDIKAGKPVAPNAPQPWLDWIAGGSYEPLHAERVSRVRSRAAQLPTDPTRKEMLHTLVEFFKAHSQREYAFERCAGELVRMMDSNIVSVDLTRPWKDGGRDALGKYRIGPISSDILVEFAIEAKCKRPERERSSGVKETSRLISRLRHRQFGIFVTTSCVHEQAYSEIIEDEHPVLIIAGADICDILQKCGLSTADAVQEWLRLSFGN
jgi:hypothetical protein